MKTNNIAHFSDEQLVEHFYALRASRQPLDSGGIETHLAACVACRSTFAGLVRTLTLIDEAPVPERGAAYGTELWQRLEPRLESTAEARPGMDWRAWFAPRRLAPVAAMAALVIVAFLAGRLTRLPMLTTGTPSQTQVASVQAAQARDRILLVAVGEHLERSQMVLVELVNAKPGSPLDISAEQHRAEDLVAANRLYRQTAERVGETGVATVLDELERVLVEIANSPTKISSPQLASLRRRIESQGILFKIRVVGTEVRGREKTAERRQVPRKTS